MTFFDTHECGPNCPLHNVMFPQDVVSSHEMFDLRTAYADAPDGDNVELTLVTIAGRVHPNEDDKSSDQHITLGFVSDYVMEFLMSIAVEVECLRPGFVGALVSAVSCEVAERRRHDFAVNVGRVDAAIARCAEIAGLPVQDFIAEIDQHDGVRDGE